MVDTVGGQVVGMRAVGSKIVGILHSPEVVPGSLAENYTIAEQDSRRAAGCRESPVRDNMTCCLFLRRGVTKS